MDLSKRSFLKRILAFLAAGGLIGRNARNAVAADPPDVPSWMKSPGAGSTSTARPPSTRSR
jgi:hypothetical protein